MYNETEKLDLSHQNIIDTTIQAKLENKNDWLSIDLSDNPITDVTSLASQKKLKSLNLTGTRVNNVSKLAEIQSLEELYLSDTQVTDLSSLAKLKNLKKLFLTSTPIKNIDTIKELKSLEELSLTDTKVSNDLSAITGLKNLKKLYINEIDLNAASLLQLKLLVNLETLEVDYEPELQYAKQELFKDLAKGKAQSTFFKIYQEHSLKKTGIDQALPGQPLSPKVEALINQILSNLNKNEMLELDNWLHAMLHTKNMLTVS